MLESSPSPSPAPKNSFSLLKLFIIGFIIIVLMLPVAWISSLITERHERSDTVLKEISSKWGIHQLVSGPFISIPYQVKIEQTDAQVNTRVSTVTRYLYLTPDSMQITGNVESTLHRRSIFKVPGYKTDINLSCLYPNLNELENLPHGLNFDWENALICFDVKDERGLKELTGNLNGEPLNFRKSTNILILPIENEPDLPLTGKEKRFKAYDEQKQIANFKFTAKSPVSNPAQVKIDLKLTLTGTRQLSFLSSAMKQNIELSGDWPSPSFTGDILPDTRSVSSQGFNAVWQTNYLNTGNKPFWLSDEPNLRFSVLAVSFLVPVNPYQQTTRTLKYSILFLMLTFMTFFFAETITRQRIHPIQYLMVGCSLIIFYLLLLSLSEHIGFGWSYLIAALSVILQISLYCYTILRTRKFALQTGGILSGLYAFLYILLQLQDSALLVGSISLFVLLAIAMYVTRNIRWYNQE